MKFKGQFLLTKNHFVNKFEMICKDILDFKLFFSPSVKFHRKTNNKLDLILLGDLFSFDEPHKNNDQILYDLSLINSETIFFEKLSKYYGEYIFIIIRNNKIKILNDATAQKEIYYTKNFSSFASTIRLISFCEDIVKHNEKDILHFYSSENFKKKLVYINSETDYKNIKHLKPNHFLELNNKKVVRFFPSNLIKKNSLEKVVNEASKIIKGYMKSISLRYPNLILPLTAGFDSRLLFLSSLDINCEYYVSQHKWMNDSHPDILISKQLTNLFGKKLVIKKDAETNDKHIDNDYTFSVDYPRYISFPEIVNNKTIINGNVSEIARCYFPRISNPKPKDLIFLSNYKYHSYLNKIYDDWIKINDKNFKKFKYNFLDMFYWEEKMGNWLSKMKTESSAQGLKILSPYNSRYLLDMMLGVDIKYRNNYNTILYKEIAKKLTDNTKISKIPYNPSIETKIFSLLAKIRLLNFYLRIRMFIKQILYK